jgi:hypothetical protein
MSSPADPSDGNAARVPTQKARREDRLKAALKANMARRKAQAKAQAEQRGTEDTRDSKKD